MNLVASVFIYPVSHVKPSNRVLRSRPRSPAAVNPVVSLEHDADLNQRASDASMIHRNPESSQLIGCWALPLLGWTCWIKGAFSKGPWCVQRRMMHRGFF